MRATAKRLHEVFVLERVLRLAFEDDLAAVDRVEPLRDARRVDEVRLRDQERDPQVLDLEHRIAEPLDDHRGEALERLVQKRQRRGERHPLGHDRARELPSCYLKHAPMAASTTLKLPERLKRRIAPLARSAGKTPHAWMVEALEVHAALAERRKAFVAEALAAEKEAGRAGRAYRVEDVPRSLATCAFDIPACAASFIASRLNSTPCFLVPI